MKSHGFQFWQVRVLALDNQPCQPCHPLQAFLIYHELIVLFPPFALTLFDIAFVLEQSSFR